MTRKEYNTAVDEYADRLFRFAVKTLRDEELARDHVQQAFARLLEKHADVDDEKVRSYLFTAVYNLNNDHFRKQKHRYAHTDESMNTSTSSTQIEQPDLKEIIDKGLESLPEQQRNVILLRDYEGYSYDEIGEITGLNPSQVKVYLFRARKALKAFIGDLSNVI